MSLGNGGAKPPVDRAPLARELPLDPAIDAARIAQRGVNQHNLDIERLNGFLLLLRKDTNLISMRLGPMETDISHLATDYRETRRAVEEIATQLGGLASKFDVMVEAMGAIKTLVLRPPPPTTPKSVGVKPRLRKARARR